MSVVHNFFDLTGKVAMVTGTSRGLGQYMARALARAGADLIITSRKVEDLAPFQAEVEALGRKAFPVALDVRNYDSIQAGVAAGLAHYGKIDILVNNAGLNVRKPAVEISWDEWNLVLETNLRGTFFVAQAVARDCMIPKGYGRIINIGSVMTFQGGLNIPAYAAAKHGLAGLTKSLANSWSNRGINVNCICPGYFETSLSHGLQDDPVRGPQILDRIPVGRWGQPDEIAGLCVFLASDASNYMHGSTVVIDGGWMSR